MTPDPAIATAADYADAMITARRAKNIILLILLLTLLGQLTIFFVVRYTTVLNTVLTTSTLTTAATQPRQAPLLEPFLYGDPALFCLLPTVRAGYRRTESDNRIRTEKSRAALVDVTRRRPWLSPSPAERGARASGRSAPRD